MKVLLMPSWYPNTIQNNGTFFREQAQFLESHGIDIKVLMPEELHTKRSWFQRFKLLVSGKSSGLQKSFLQQDPEAFSFPLILQKSWSENKQIEKLKQAYLQAFELLLKKGWTPNVIHVQGTVKAAFGAAYISKIHNIPFVVIEHSPFKIKVHSEFIQDQIKQSLMLANKIAGVSNYQKNRLIEDGINRDIEVVWNLMDEEKFSRGSQTENSKFVITTITRPVKVKDVDTFFEAVTAFIKQNNDPKNIEIIAVGHNALFDKNANTSYYEKKAKSLGILEYCQFYATLSRTEILNVLQRTNVFVSTSLDEPYGVSIREAMLCGIPVVSTKSGGPEDTINDQNGALVDLKDYNAIASFLSEIYKEKRAFDSEYIRNYVISQSGREAFLKRMNEFYTIIDD